MARDLQRRHARKLKLEAEEEEEVDRYRKGSDKHAKLREMCSAHYGCMANTSISAHAKYPPDMPDMNPGPNLNVGLVSLSPHLRSY